MEVDDVSPALRDRLGPEATLGLAALLDKARHQWSAAVTERAVERFDARLTAEISGLRIEVKRDINDLRVELKQDINDLRVELSGQISKLEANVSTALLNQTRWMFGMWVGQLAATAAIVAGMFRIFVP